MSVSSFDFSDADLPEVAGFAPSVLGWAWCTAVRAGAAAGDDPTAGDDSAVAGEVSTRAMMGGPSALPFAIVRSCACTGAAGPREGSVWAIGVPCRVSVVSVFTFAFGPLRTKAALPAPTRATTAAATNATFDLAERRGTRVILRVTADSDALPETGGGGATMPLWFGGAVS